MQKRLKIYNLVKEDEIDSVKMLKIEEKAKSLMQKTTYILPKAVELADTFTSLGPFSKIIGKTIYGMPKAVELADTFTSLGPFSKIIGKTLFYSLNEFKENGII